MANSSNESGDTTIDNTKDSGLDKSIVGKLMSGIINSTPLSKWFRKDDSKSSRPRDEEDDEDISYLQPLPKRQKLPDTPYPLNNINNVASSPRFPEPKAGPSGLNARKLFETRASTSQELEINGSESGESTSGYSSVPKRKEKEDKVKPLFAHDEASPSRSLFSPRTSLNSSLSSRRPRFQVSSFTSPNFVDRTLSTERILASPFYNGRTTYGGASAYGRRLVKPNEEQKTVKVQVNHKANEAVTLSKTARRILSTLEQYSTPIKDAKKVPVEGRRRGILEGCVGAAPYMVRKNQAVKELQVPTVPDLLQMKQRERLQNSTETMRQLASKSKSDLNKEEYKLRTEDERSKHSNKMKSSVGAVRHKGPSTEPVTEVKLPKVALPITTLPKFNLNLKPANETKPTETPTIPSPIKTVIEKKKDNGFTFSAPLIIGSGTKTITSINCFKFSEPLNAKKQKINGENVIKLDQFKLNDRWECDSCLVRNNKTDEKCVACGVAKPGSEKSTDSGFGEKFKPSVATWECTTCLIRNKNELAKCAACETPKPGAKPSETKSTETKPSFSFGVKPATDTWECQTCLIRNKNELEKCAACETPKPGSKPTVQALKPSKPMFSFGIKPEWECKTCLVRNKQDAVKCIACEEPKDTDNSKAGFGDAFKPKSDEWECDSCMVRNQSTANKCVCCGSVKAGKPSEKLIEISKKEPVNTFNFGINKAATVPLKFGIPISTSTTASTIPTISFGDKPKPSEATPTVTFSFGVPTTSTTPVSTTASLTPAPTTSTNVVLPTTTVSNPLLKPDEKLPEKATPAPSGFKFGLEPIKKEEVKTTPNSKPETSIAFTPMSATFQFKPAAVNGDAVKPKETEMKTNIFELNKPKETKTNIFDLNKPKESPPKPALFEMPKKDVVEPVKKLELPFNSISSKPVEMPAFKSSESPFNKPALFANKSPFATMNKTTTETPVFGVTKPELTFGKSESPFANKTSKPSDIQFGKPTTESPFAMTEKPKFASESTKPIMFGDGNSTKAATKKETIFGGNSAPETNLFTPSAAAPSSFSFSKPTETGFGGTSSSQPVFKFGGESTTAPKKLFGDNTTTNVNGFASSTTKPSFGSQPSAGFTETKPFSFAEPAKPAGFPFGNQSEKPVFSFGSTQAPTTAGFNFSPQPSTAFSFGAASKETRPFGTKEVQPFGTPAVNKDVQQQSFGVAAVNKEQPFSVTKQETQPFGVPVNKDTQPFGIAKESQPFGAPSGSVFGSGPVAAAAKNGGFNFGASANSGSEKAVFTFGSSQNTGQMPGAAFPAPPQGGFNFGAVTAQPTQMGVPQVGAFNFTGAPPSFNFTDGNSTAQNQPRRIKRAVRRTQR